MICIMKKVSKEEFEKVVSESINIADVCRKLGWQPRGDNYKIVHKYLDEYDTDTSHFKRVRTNIGNVLNKEKEKKAEYYLKEKSYVKTSSLKWKLFSEGLKKYKCEKCGCTHWEGKQIALQLHHINGDDTDNRFENLQILCPNCHSQTDNYCGRNAIKNTITKKYYCKVCHKEMEKTPSGLCDECYNKLTEGKLDISNVPQGIKVRSYSTCVDCGKQIDSHSTRCNECSKKIHRKVEWPSKEKLEELIKEKPFTRIAEQYGVSDKAITKWCKYYGLPHRKKDIKKLK